MKAIIRLNTDVELVRDLAAHGYGFKYSGNRVIEVFNCDADHINKFIRENGYDLDAFTVSQVRESSDSKNQQLVDRLAELHNFMEVGGTMSCSTPSSTSAYFTASYPANQAFTFTFTFTLTLQLLCDKAGVEYKKVIKNGIVYFKVEF